ncbi:MAG TPA: M14 family zinc carboxypeptidase, partial [Vicinamibacteria bacterium]|nr:M14 family zinc carboxypeptidase [Vicinamibacteria bacterium]
MKPRLFAVLGLLAVGTVRADAPPGEVPEPGTREAIAKATTEPRFVSPWVADLPDHPSIPSPSDFLGHIAGAPGELTRTEKIYAYYRALDAASDRVAVETIGTSEEGRDLLLVVVGGAASVADAAQARADMALLADPRRLDEAAMEALVARVKPVYMLHGGLHSMETGSPEMLMELVYRLAVSEAPLIRQIREKVTVIVNPVAEPDGRDRQVDWFYRFQKGKTDFDEIRPLTPPYWGKYVLHDNNRDGIQRRLALTRATQDAFLRWHPIVVHDLHESIPLLSIWTGTGPYNVNLDPSLTSEWHTIAFHEVASLTAMGMPGVWTWGFGEGWGHFYADSVAVNHNAIGRGYETFGNHTAETVERVIDPENEKYAGVSVTDPEWYRTVPPPKKLRWSLRNNVNYQQTGVLAALQYTALHGADMMRNVWRRGRNALRRGETEKPYAVAIPLEQADARRMEAMVDLLRAHGIEVSRAREAFTVREGAYPAGTLLVRMDQPYRGFALDLLLPQKFP